MLDDTEEFSSTETNLNPFDAPKALANLTTGMDLFQIKIEKLVNAPSEWNFYSPLPDDKMEELVNSIRDKGLLHALVVWAQDDGTYMILSGHNRKKAIETLYEQTQDKKYKQIHCYVKKKGQLDEVQAQGIIIDTNWIQRILTTDEKSQSIFRKYAQIEKYKRKTNKNGDVEHTRDIIAKQFDLRGRQVSNYMRLNYLIPTFKEMIKNGEINIKNGVKISYFTDEIQQWIIENYSNIVDNKHINMLDKNMTKQDLTIIFKSQQNETTIKNIPIQEELKKYVKIKLLNGAIENKVLVPINMQGEFNLLLLKFFAKLK